MDVGTPFHLEAPDAQGSGHLRGEAVWVTDFRAL